MTVILAAPAMTSDQRRPQLGIPNFPDQTYVTILGYGLWLVRRGTQARTHAQLWKTAKDAFIGYGCYGGDECEVTYAACLVKYESTASRVTSEIVRFSAWAYARTR